MTKPCHKGIVEFKNSETVPEGWKISDQIVNHFINASTEDVERYSGDKCVSSLAKYRSTKFVIEGCLID